MLGCAPLPLQYVVYRFRGAVHTAAAPVCMLQCSTTRLVLLQPDKDNHKLLSLAQTPANGLLVAVQSTDKLLLMTSTPLQACTITCYFVTSRLPNRNLIALRPTCCNGLLPLMGGDSQWPIKGPAAALLGMLQLRVVDPVRAKATLCTVFPPVAFLPTSDLPGARKDFFRRLQN